MIKRILQIIDYKGINKSIFYKQTGLSNGFLDKVKDIGVSKLELILNTYPEIEVNWLLTGEGEMLKSGSKKEPEEEKNKGPDHRYVELLQKNNQYLEQIVALKDEVSLLKEKISILKKRDIPVHTSQMVAESPQKLEKRTKETAD